MSARSGLVGKNPPGPIWGHLGPFFCVGRKNAKNVKFLPIFLGGPLLLSTLGGAIGIFHVSINGFYLDFCCTRESVRTTVVLKLQAKWQVAFQREIKHRPLSDVVAELRGRVIEAAQKLEQELAGGAERLGLDGSSSATEGMRCELVEPLGITTMDGVQLWLAEDHIASCTSTEIQRIREAAAVLSSPKPRSEDVQSLQLSLIHI